MAMLTRYENKLKMGVLFAAAYFVFPYIKGFIPVFDATNSLLSFAVIFGFLVVYYIALHEIGQKYLVKRRV